MIGPVDDLLEVAAIFVAEERERERGFLFLFFFLVSRVWLCKLANLASLELCIYRVEEGKGRETKRENS